MPFTRPCPPTNRSSPVFTPKTLDGRCGACFNYLAASLVRYQQEGGSRLGKEDFLRTGGEHLAALSQSSVRSVLYRRGKPHRPFF